MSGAFFYCTRIEPGPMLAVLTTVAGRPLPDGLVGP
jgi:hypothetical protein